MKRDIIYLGSQSPIRKQLLLYAGIEYKTLDHASNEQLAYSPNDFGAHVLTIAQDKMKSLTLPSREEVGKDYLFALTADTLVRTIHSNKILGKPTDRAHANLMLEYMRQEPVEVMTGCCLEKFYWRQNAWVQESFEHWTAGAVAEFIVDEAFVDTYFALNPNALNCAGGASIEDFGSSFLKTVNGSYSGVMGLPLFQLRQALQKLDFKF